MLRSLLLPLGALCIGLGCLIGGRSGQVLLVAGTVLAGVDCVLVVAG